MRSIYLVRQGYDNPDCSPEPIKAFQDLNQAIEFCQTKQEELKKRHLDCWPNGSFRWEIRSDTSFTYYYQSYMKFDSQQEIPFGRTEEYPDEVLCIQEIELV